MKMSNRPCARISDLTTAFAGEDLIVHDGALNHYHTLNATAAQIWRQCDGTRSPRMIAESIAMPADVVDLALSDLASRGLLEGIAASPAIDRRAVIKRLAAAGALGAVVLPVIASISGADSARADLSCVLNGDSCAITLDCCDPFAICFNNLCNAT